MARKALLVVLALAAVGLGWAWPEHLRRTHSIDPASVAHQEGHAYWIGPLPESVPGDDATHPDRSPVEMLEDGSVLMPPHSMHEDIRRMGGGRYSHWGRQLVFSASDNSDPRTNGRKYAFAYVTHLPAYAGWILTCVGVTLFLWTLRGELVGGVRSLRAVRIREPWSNRVMAASGALLIGVGAFLSEWTQTFPLAVQNAEPHSGHAYFLERLDVPQDARFAGDDVADGRRSPFTLREDGERLASPHSFHEDIRRWGSGRHSHWGQALLFSTSDNSDPRVNGRTYDLAYDRPVAEGLRWTAGVLGLLLIVYSQRLQWARELRAARGAFAAIRGRERLRVSWVHAALFALMVALALAGGMERSGWILVTQPVDSSHAINSLLGYSYLDDGRILHKENYSSFLQVALFSGFEVTPDLYFRRPVYTFMATVLSALMGVATSLVVVNLIGWAAAAWVCHRFTRRFYEDEEAARWAALLAIVGIGFVLHALDMSAHLLAFTFYMGGVLLVFHSEVWRRRRGLRTHATIALYLMVACLQYNMGVALTAAYVLVAFRRNSPVLVLGAALAAIAAQPAWGWIIGEIQHLHTGAPPADLSTTEREYLARAVAAWSDVFGRPPLDAAGFIWRTLVSFLWFEVPLVVLVGAANLLADLRRGAEGRARLAFAWPFLAMPLAAALVFSTAAGARGYLIYGISIFFFASCGAAIAALGRHRPGYRLPVGGALVAMSLIWSTAHFANVLGPAKAYFVGVYQGADLFVPGSWEATSLTGAEPTPRLFGGRADLADAGVTHDLPSAPIPEHRGAQYAIFASALFAVLAGLLLVAATPIGWRMSLLATLALLAIPAWCSRNLARFPAISVQEAMYRLETAGPLVYEVSLAEPVRLRLVESLKAGREVQLFAAHYWGAVSPVMAISSHPVALAKHTGPLWRPDTRELLAALEGTPGAKLSIAFPAGQDATLGGWQRVGLPGRAVVAPGVQRPPALPAIEVRVMRDPANGVPSWIGF